MVKPPNELRRTVVREGFWTFLTTFISRVGGLIFTIILARILMPEGFGLYSLALSVSIVFITLADAGINQTLLRYVAASIEKDHKRASAYFRYLLSLKIKLTLLVTTALLVSSYFLAYILFDKPAIFPLLVVLSAYTLITAIQGFFEPLFYTNNQVSKLALKEIVFQCLKIVLVLAMIRVFFTHNPALGATVGLLFASLGTLVVLLYFYNKIFHFTKDAKTTIDKKKVLTFVGFLTLSSLAGVLFSYMDTLIMGIFLSFEYLGYYKVAISLVIAIAGALSFPGVFLSVLTRISKKNMQESFDKIIKTLLIFVIPATIGLIMLSRYFIVFLYGYEYLAAAPILYILSPFIFLFVTVSIFLNVLAAKEKTRDFSLLTLGCTIINVILIVIVIKWLLPQSELAATLGVASVTLTSWILYFIGGIIILRQRMNIRFKFKYMVKPLIASGVMAIVLHLFQSEYNDMTLYTGLIEVTIGAIVYFVILLLMREVKIKDVLFLFSLLPQYRIKYKTKMFLRNFLKINPS